MLGTMLRVMAVTMMKNIWPLPLRKIRAEERNILRLNFFQRRDKVASENILKLR